MFLSFVYGLFRNSYLCLRCFSRIPILCLKDPYHFYIRFKESLSFFACGFNGFLFFVSRPFLVGPHPFLNAFVGVPVFLLGVPIFLLKAFLGGPILV